MVSTDVVGETARVVRVWIARCIDRTPDDWHAVPPQAIIEQEAQSGHMSLAQAAAFVEGFNHAMLVLGEAANRWAVAVHVGLAYDGDFRPGQLIASRAICFADTRSA